MRVFHIDGPRVTETDALPAATPATGFVWVAMARREFEVLQAETQQALQRLGGHQLVDLHVADLLSQQLPSHFDYTSEYDVLVFRRLAAGQTETDLSRPGELLHVPPTGPRAAQGVLNRIDTSPVGFAIFDGVLLTVHPTSCTVRDGFASKLLALAKSDASIAALTAAHGSDLARVANRVPVSPADLMLRIVNQMVDGYLDLRRELSRQLDTWQSDLLEPRRRETDWRSLLAARMTLHHLDEICEDQRSAVQDWIDALETWPEPTTPAAKRDHDLLRVRSRDVLEHIERVIHHVRRLEQSSETAVQVHFSVQSNRTNDIMRTLTVLTAIFLPLNLIAGIFGMNFEFMPFIHQDGGFWMAMGTMGLTALGLSVYFTRKRYLGRTGR